MQKKTIKLSASLLLLFIATPALSAETVTFRDGLLTVQAHNLPLKQILQQLADQTGAEITVEGTADDAVSADFAKTDLAAALLRISPDYNSIVLYRGADETSVSAIRLYAISARPTTGDIVIFSPKATGK